MPKDEPEVIARLKREMNDGAAPDHYSVSLSRGEARIIINYLDKLQRERDKARDKVMELEWM